MEQYFSGNLVIPNTQQYAHCYCGFQFGYFAGQLGDGRAIALGEVLDSKSGRIELQLKGAGKTPYSRGSDGRAVLRSSIREFLCSELNYFLGIPTTRAATLISSDTQAVRDPFYSGNQILENCCTVLRLAPNFIRFGSFEICRSEDEITGKSGPSKGEIGLIKELLDHVIKFHYFKTEKLRSETSSEKGVNVDPENGFNLDPVHEDLSQLNEEERYVKFFSELVKRTAKLVALWQCYGWCHGVLNTDNMSILGLTIGKFVSSYKSSLHFCWQTKITVPMVLWTASIQITSVTARMKKDDTLIKTNLLFANGI